MSHHTRTPPRLRYHNPMPRRLFITCLLTLLIPALASAQDQTLTLRPAFKEGQTRTYEEWALWTTTTDVQFPGGVNNRQEILKVNALTRWEVLRVRPNGSATCKLSVDWIELQIEASARGETDRFTVDTRKGPGDHKPIHDSLSEVVNNPLTYTFAPDGTIEKVDGVNQRKLRIDNVGLDRLKQEAIFGVASETQPGNLPATLREGSTWKQTLDGYAFENINLELPLQYQAQTITTIEDVPIAIVSVTARPKLIEPETPPLPPGATPPDFQPGPTSYDSEIFFDLDRREVAARHSSQSQSYTLRLNAPNGNITVTRTEAIQSQSLRVQTSD